jgi:hypothetical protein
MARALKDGGIADRVYKLLQRRKAGTELSSAELAKALGLTQHQVTSNCQSAARAGWLVKTRGIVDGVSVSHYSIGPGPSDDVVTAADDDGDVAPARAFNCSLWEDGELMLQLGDESVTLSKAEADRLCQYLARAWQPPALQQLLPAAAPSIHG